MEVIAVYRLDTELVVTKITITHVFQLNEAKSRSTMLK